MTTEGSASRRQIYGDPSLVNEVLRLTPCSCAIFPTSERKGRAKQLFIALRPMAFELYKQRTDVEKKKTPKHLIEFDHLFNISLQKEPNHFKGDVLVLMTPKTTYYIEPNDTEATVKDWFELTFERVREARSDRVLRPVFKEDFFEAAWDVVAIKKPKLKREVKREKMHDLVEATANLQGRRRLCVTPTSYMLFKMEVLANASPETDQYYEKSSFYEFPINVISNYGKQEKYFFLRLGRYSDLGGGEIWLNCDSGDTAKEVHDTICRLSEREAEKRRLNGVVLPLGAISSRVIKSKQHRERAAENRKRAAEAEALKNAEAAGVDHATGTNSAEDSATSPKSEKLEKKIRHSSGGSNKATPAKKFPFVGDMAFKITSKLHYSSSSNSPGLFTANPEFADPNMPFATSYAQPMEPKMSVVQKSVVSEPVVAPATPEAAPFDQPGDPTSPSSSSVAPRNLSPRPYQGDADDYMPYDAPVDSRKGSKASAMPLRQTSLMSTTESSYNVAPAPTTTKATTPEAPPTFATPSLPVQRPIADAYPEETQFPAAFMPRYIPDDDEDVPNDYAFMGVGVPVDNSLKGAIKETRTYVSDVSDSTESCFSAAKRPKRDPNADTYDSTEFRPSPTSAAEDPTHSQRAFSLGSKPFHKILPLVLQHGLIPTPQSNSNYIIDSSESGDIRKRAHSAGSKTWNFGLHRKMAADGQAGSNDLMRSRTGSMGTGTKRPFPRPTDHVEMDWSDGSKQGSIASLDSPNSRSRNSSMGMAMSANLRMAADNAKKSIVDKAAEKLAACKVEPRWEDFNFPPIGSPHFRQYTDRGNSGDANRRQSTPDEEDYVAISTTSGGNSAKKNVPRVINTILESDTSDSEMMPVVDQYALSPSGTPMPPVPMSTPIPTISPLPPPPTPALGSAKSNVIEYSFLVPTAEPSPTTRSTASSPLPAVQSFIPASPGNVSKTSADGRESSTVSDDGSTGGEAGSSGNGKKCEYAVLKMNDK